MKKITPVFILAMLVCLAVPSVAAPTYTVQTVSLPDDNITQLLGINDAGMIAGFHGPVAQGFTLQMPNHFTSQNFPGSAQTMVLGINDAGDTAGITVDGTGFTHGYTDIGGVFQVVDAPGTIFNQALGINSSNITVGYSATDMEGQVGQLAYSQHGGVFTDINHLLPANQNSQAVGINNAGDIVGFYLPLMGADSLGFLDKGGVITIIDPFGSNNTQALGINQSGEIVGFYVDASDVQHGFVDIGGIFSTFDVAGADSTTINGVNNLGQLVGFATFGDNTVGFLASPTPEPATWSLLGIASIGFAFFRRSRFNKGR